jgi:hypothetical protein
LFYGPDPVVNRKPPTLRPAVLRPGAGGASSGPRASSRSWPASKPVGSLWGPMLPSAQPHPVTLRPEQPDEISAALSTFGYVVLAEAYSAEDVRELNELCDATQRSSPESWADSDAQGGLADLTWYNPLCDPQALPVLERFVRHERIFPCVNRALGAAARFAEFDFRETVRAGSSAVAGNMPWHHDQGAHRASSAAKIARRVHRSKMVISRTRTDGGVPHHHEHLCCIVYLTDVGEAEPAFAVIPGSHRIPAVDLPERGVPDTVRTWTPRSIQLWHTDCMCIDT